MRTREALMRAYVHGWHDGHYGARTDEGKVACAEALMGQTYPTKEALLNVLIRWRDWMDNNPDVAQRMTPAELCREMDAMLDLEDTYEKRHPKT